MKTFDLIQAETEDIATEIIDASLKVHRALGPGLLESIYEACLAYELKLRKISVKTQVCIPLVYEGLRLETGLYLDLLVANQVIVELKAVERMNPVFEAQLLSYLKLTGHRVGLLINFHVALLKDGMKRIVL